MRIFVTDEGRYWNHENPILERYADCVTVVCLNGKKVTDKYECFVSPYEPSNLEENGVDTTSLKYNALKSVRNELRWTHGFHEKLVFLADNEPESLYPYLVLRDRERYNGMHLWCMSPWEFENSIRKQEYFALLHDLSDLRSLLYLDSNMIFERLKEDATYADADKYCREYFAELLPLVLYDIDYNMEKIGHYHFDFNVNRYIKTDNAFRENMLAKALNKKNVKEHQPCLEHALLGIVLPIDYPNTDEWTKEQICEPLPRLEGKQICEELKKMRKALADANGIPYKVIKCPSVGPCAGTCAQCDKEIRKLQEKLMKINECEREYPYFAVGENMPEELPHAIEMPSPYKGFMGFICPPEEVENDE